MALQTKTFSWGDYAWQSYSNAYVIDLILTENSVSQDGNSSEIGYELILRSGNQNRFNGQIDSVLRFNGEEIDSGSRSISAAYNDSWTLLSGTTIVDHNSDGSLTMPIEMSIKTYNSYAPPSTTQNWKWALTDIPRESSITSATAVTLGDVCSVKWTPNSASFWYKLKFSIGNWSATTDPIHPNKTSAYTYEEYTIPVDVAKQITGSKAGTMTVELTTYADNNCATRVGNSDSKLFTVTVPETDATRPTVTMSLTPVQPSVMAEDSPLYRLYLQGVTRIKASVSAAPKLSTSITGYSLEVDEKKYSISSTITEAMIQSDPVVNPGNVTVIGKATDKRTITGSTEESITVLPYSKPKIKATAYRCASDKSRSETGTFLKIDIISADYEPVEVEGEAQNSCELLWRYRPEKGDFSDVYTEWSDEALLEGTLATDTAYVVEILAVDAAGQKDTVYVNIPTESIYKHKRPGGRGLGLGGYCEEDDLLDVHWNARVRKNLRVDGQLQIGEKMWLDIIYPVGSVYISAAAADPSGLFGGTWEQVKDRFLLAAGEAYEAGTTGGEETHTLTTDEMPAHSHYAYGWAEVTDYSGDYKVLGAKAGAGPTYDTYETGGGQPHNNMPPYLVVYVWIRIA